MGHTPSTTSQPKWALWTSASTALLTLLYAAGCTTSMGKAPSGHDLIRLAQSQRYRSAKRAFVNESTVHTAGLKEAPALLSLWWDAPNPEPPHTIPLAQPSLSSSTQHDQARITWVGHSTALVEMDGVRILTDPIWSERCSPFSWAGPQRYHKPGIDWSQLPNIDAVVISHDHYDHLDHDTVLKLAQRGTHFVVPLGVGSHLKAWGVTSYTELDWWDRHTIQGHNGQRVELIATPAQHFSGRTLNDRNATLWASWAFVGPTQRVFFGGDTGYFDGFKTIGKRLGPFDATLMPIGAYNVHWSDIHLNPEEALQAHRDVRGNVFIPVHWGTFNLALHTWQEPVERLIREAEKHGYTDIRIPRPGETIPLNNNNQPPDAIASVWWRPKTHTP